MNHKAFTLVELMVVIAIIAILAVGSVTSFSEYLRKANISKYKQVAISYAKERYGSCVGAPDCYFRTVIYEYDGDGDGTLDLYKANADLVNQNAQSSPVGSLFVSSATGPVFSQDGKYVYYLSHPSRNMYRKEIINSDPLDLGEQLTGVSFVWDAIALGRDGDKLIYNTTGQQHARLYDLSTQSSVALGSAGGWTGFGVSWDNRDVVYRNLSANAIIISPLSGGSSRTFLVGGGGTPSPRFSPDGDYIFYIRNTSAIYKKFVNNKDINDLGELVYSGGRQIKRVEFSLDGKYMYFFEHPGGGQNAIYPIELNENGDTVGTKEQILFATGSNVNTRFAIAP